MRRHVLAGLGWALACVAFVGCGELAGVRDDLELVDRGPGETDAATDGPLVCRESETLCSGACVNLSSDPLHCGSCTIACKKGEVCDDARCSATGCSVGLTDCGGACANLAIDELHCGACDNACKASEDCLAGGCQGSVIPKRDSGPPS